MTKVCNLREIVAALHRAPTWAALMVWAVACSPSSPDGSDVKAGAGGYRISGRLNMNDSDKFQCYSLGSYTGPEKVQGRWIAGVDGASLGTVHDAHKGQGSQCGRTFIIRYQGQCEEFIVADRIWENDGPGGYQYGAKGEADRKGANTGPGYPQIDIAKRPFKSLFDSKNPTGGYELVWGASCSGGAGFATPASPSPANQALGQAPVSNERGQAIAPASPPSTTADSQQFAPSGSPGCLYADASKHNGWGWNEATKKPCEPLTSSQPWGSPAPTPAPVAPPFAQGQPDPYDPFWGDEY